MSLDCIKVTHHFERNRTYIIIHSPILGRFNKPKNNRTSLEEVLRLLFKLFNQREEQA